METNKNILTAVWNNSSVETAWKKSSPEMHIAWIIGGAIAVHLLVKIVRHVSEWFIRQSHAKENPLEFVTGQPKFVTLTRLIVSGVTFVVYFVAFGFVLVFEFHTNLKAYLASASVIGLAVSFGSQGLVQDIVIGVTLICSNAMDVGEIVDLSGTIGRVEEIGLRFTKLVNFYNQVVFIPNRNIGNVIRFAEGGVYAYADVQAPPAADPAKVRQAIINLATGLATQFREIILDEPTIGRMEKVRGGDWNFLRARFKVWPGQGSLIETTFVQQVVTAMKAFDPNYANWMVTVTYRATVTMDEEDSAEPVSLAPAAAPPLRRQLEVQSAGRKILDTKNGVQTQNDGI
jgi:small conductance mechanosensitive channel